MTVFLTEKRIRDEAVLLIIEVTVTGVEQQTPFKKSAGRAGLNTDFLKDRIGYYCGRKT